MNIAVAGTGYVGLVTGVCLAGAGHRVTCVDTDASKVAQMQRGISPIYEAELETLMHRHASQLSFTTDYASAYAQADVIFIGVGTPEKRDGSANLSYVYAAAEQIAQSAARDCIVVVKSTVPIGTNDRLEAYMRARLVHDVHIEVASNPEFLSQGTAVYDTLHASRIVLGVESGRAERVLEAVYAPFGLPMVVTNRRSAEMIKYASNDFLALKISYINEIANLCEALGADVDAVAAGMGLDPRIGGRFLKPGIGYGGSCFPKDTKALHWTANYYDRELKTVKAAIEVNERQKLRLVQKARNYYESFAGLEAAVLGLAFKPGTDDLREAPALVNVPILLEDGAHVRVWDPAAAERFREYYPEQITCCSSIDEALRGADICFIFTEWEEIRTYDVGKFAGLMRRPVILDGRNCFLRQAFGDQPVIYSSIGRPDVRNIQKKLLEE